MTIYQRNLLELTVDKVKVLFRKGSKAYRNGIRTHVTNVEHKGGGNLSTISILDQSGETGIVQLQTWEPSKKNKECTIQADKVKSEPVKFVNIFAKIFVKYALEVAMKGNHIKLMFRNETAINSNEKKKQDIRGILVKNIQGELDS